MSNRRSFALVAAAVFLVAVAMRTIPLYWSPLAFNTDGFKFASLARETIRMGHIPTSMEYFQSDEYTFSALLAICSELTGISPLYVAQGLTASIGATTCLFVVVITRRISRQLRWSPLDVRIATVVAGLVLATEGIFLGRSAAVTSEGVGHLFVILGLFVFARALWTSRRSWGLLSGVILVLFPVTHDLSTIIGAFAAASLLVLFIRYAGASRGSVMGAVLVTFWIYVGVYYSAFELPDMSRISSVPGLFVAWVIVLILLTAWLSEARPWIQREIPTAILLGGASLFTVNAFAPIFPGTATTGGSTVAYVAPIALVGLIAFRAIPILVDAGVDGYAVLGLLLGVISVIGFALTGGLTVPYQDLAVRSQTFLHIAFAVLAGLGVIVVSRRWNSTRVRTTLVVFVLVCSLISAPLAFSGLRATSAQPLVTQSEFEAATFAATHSNQWTSDGHMTEIVSKYYPERSSPSKRGVYVWLHDGGSVPKCPVVLQHSWITVGAQLFPASPERISSGSYRYVSQRRNRVYTSGIEQLQFTVSNGYENSTC